MMMQVIVTLDETGFEYCKDVLLVVLELLHVLFAVGRLDELLRGSSGPSEDHNLQALEKMALVRAEEFQFPSNLHRRRPQ